MEETYLFKSYADIMAELLKMYFKENNLFPKITNIKIDRQKIASEENAFIYTIFYFCNDNDGKEDLYSKYSIRLSDYPYCCGLAIMYDLQGSVFYSNRYDIAHILPYIVLLIKKDISNIGRMQLTIPEASMRKAAVISNRMLDKLGGEKTKFINPNTHREISIVNLDVQNVKRYISGIRVSNDEVWEQLKVTNPELIKKYIEENKLKLNGVYSEIKDFFKQHI